MGDVVELDVATRLDIPPDKLLEKALGKMQRVVIIGIDHDGRPYFASSAGDLTIVLWDIEVARAATLRMGDV